MRFEGGNKTKVYQQSIKFDVHHDIRRLNMNDPESQGDHLGHTRQV